MLGLPAFQNVHHSFFILLQSDSFDASWHPYETTFVILLQTREFPYMEEFGLWNFLVDITKCSTEKHGKWPSTTSNSLVWFSFFNSARNPKKKPHRGGDKDGIRILLYGKIGKTPSTSMSVIE